ncbi:MAG: septum formation inhibitor Maf [Lachnospiraceae bacterium]|nr:septum formation inhibitor Maf [Lachnospiraceae bacterium]
MTEKHIILASNSPRRKELLKQAGFIFTVIPSNVEEVITETEPKEIVKELSGQKAKNIFDNLSKESAANSLILGADTVVAWENEKGMFSILGKPKDKEDAFAMLKNLQGKTHFVYTGVTLIWQEDGQVQKESFAVETKVTFYPMSETEIKDYIETGEPMDKAGAYGIQGKGAVYVKEIAGDYNNVVGLPLSALYQRMNQFKIF